MTKSKVPAKLKIDAETRKKLMGYSVVTDTIDFIPELKDVPEELCPVFKVRAITAEDQRKVKFMFMDSYNSTKINKKEQVKRDDYLNDLTRRSIVGIENLIDLSTDTYIEFEQQKGKDYLSKGMYETLPTMLKTLIMNHIMAANGLIEA